MTRYLPCLCDVWTQISHRIATELQVYGKYYIDVPVISNRTKTVCVGYFIGRSRTCRDIRRIFYWRGQLGARERTLPNIVMTYLVPIRHTVLS